MSWRNVPQPWPTLPPPTHPADPRSGKAEPGRGPVDGIVYSESWSLRLRQHPLRGRQVAPRRPARNELAPLRRSSISPSASLLP
jgi:hypothetical protein